MDRIVRWRCTWADANNHDDDANSDDVGSDADNHDDDVGSDDDANSHDVGSDDDNHDDHDLD